MSFSSSEQDELIHLGAFYSLCEAVAAGDLPKVEELIEKGANQNKADFELRTPLHIAAAKGHLKLVKYLVSKVTNPNPLSIRGGTPLSEAISYHHVEVIEYLKSIGCTSEKEELGANLLKAQSEKEIEELVARGTDINFADPTGRTMLHYACADGNLSRVRYLTVNRADINIKDNLGATPLRDALSLGHMEVINWLRSRNAQCDYSKEELSIFLCEACDAGDIVECKKLLDMNASASGKYYDGRTPLHVAASNGHVELVKLLLSQKDPDVNLGDRSGATPLYHAIIRKHTAIEILLREIAPPLYFQTWRHLIIAVSEASHEGNLAMLQFCFENQEVGASSHVAHIKDDDGRTPLHIAATEGHLKIIKYILEFGIDINALDNWNGTPLGCALRNCNFDICTYLQNLGAILGPGDKEIFPEISNSTSVLTDMAQIDVEISIPALLTKIKESSNHLPTLDKALKFLLTKLKPHDDLQNRTCTELVAHGGLSVLIKISQKHKNHVSIQKHTCQIFRQLCVTRSDFIENLVVENGISVCFNILRNENFDLSPKFTALSCLRAIFDRDFFDPELISDMVARDGGIHLLLCFIQKNENSTDVVHTALRVLWQLAIISVKNLHRIQSENATDIIYQIWKKHGDHPEVIYTSAGIISAILPEVPELVKIFVDEQRGTSLLVSTIKKHAKSSEIIFCCVCIFCVIFQSRATFESNFQTELVRTHSLEFFLHTLETHPGEVHLHENIGLLLNDVAFNYLQLRKVLLEKGFGKIIKNSARNFPESEILGTIRGNMKIYKNYLLLVKEEAMVPVAKEEWKKNDSEL